MSQHPYRALDVERLRREFAEAEPFPHLAVPDFLEPGFALEVARSYPGFDEARSRGREFRAVNERRKVQVTDPAVFPDAVRRLGECLASPELVESFSAITGIPNLLPDPELVGGGMHLMAGGSHLDVHVDFNRIDERDLYRRLNVLVFLNPRWEEDWGGELELWDRAVSRRVQVFPPRLNQLVLFETSDHSFHGVRRVRSPDGTCRISFAGYYYTREAPPGWTGVTHSTVFRARPDEWWKGRVLMPAESALRRARPALRRLARRVLRP